MRSWLLLVQSLQQWELLVPVLLLPVLLLPVLELPVLLLPVLLLAPVLLLPVLLLAPELPLLVPGRLLVPEPPPQALMPMQKELGPPPLELLVVEQPLVEESQEPVRESQQTVSLRQVAH